METAQQTPNILKEVDMGNLKNWTGMAEGWRLKDIETVLNHGTKVMQYTLGEYLFDLYEYEFQHQSQPLQVFADSAGEVSLLRLQDPKLKNSAQELEAIWGKPALRTHLPNDHKFAPATQWVYPQRGITLYVLDEKSTVVMSYSAVSLYAPTTVDHYLEQLGGSETIRYFENH